MSALNKISRLTYSPAKRVFFGIVFLLYASSVFSQAVEFTISIERDSVKIGEPFVLSVSLQVPAAVYSKTVVFPPLKQGDTLHEVFEVWNTSEQIFVPDAELNGIPYSIREQQVEIASFENGFLTIKPLVAVVSGDTITSNALLVYVGAPEIAEDAEIFDIKDLYEDPLSFWERIKLFFVNYKWWVLTLVLFVVALVVGIIYYKKHKRNKKTTPFVRPKTMRERYMEQFEGILAKQLWQKGNLKAYHTELTLLLRGYIAERFGVPTFEKTTEEIMSSLRFESITPEWKTKLGNLLSVSDLVKFAKGKTSPIENERLAEDVKTFILEHLTAEELVKEEEIS